MSILFMLLRLYSLILLIRVILSWVPNIDRTNPLVKLLYDVTEPVLRPIREMLPATPGLDLSPLVLLIGINILVAILANIA